MSKNKENQTTETEVKEVCKTLESNGYSTYSPKEVEEACEKLKDVGSCSTNQPSPEEVKNKTLEDISKEKELFLEFKPYLEELKERVRLCKTMNEWDEGTYYEMVYASLLCDKVNADCKYSYFNDVKVLMETTLSYIPIGAIKEFSWQSKHKIVDKSYRPMMEMEYVKGAVEFFIFALIVVPVLILSIIFLEGWVLLPISMMCGIILGNPHRTQCAKITFKELKAYKRLKNSPSLRNRYWLRELVLSDVKQIREDAWNLMSKLDNVSCDSRNYYKVLAEIEMVYNRVIPEEVN